MSGSCTGVAVLDLVATSWVLIGKNALVSMNSSLASTDLVLWMREVERVSIGVCVNIFPVVLINFIKGLISVVLGLTAGVSASADSSDTSVLAAVLAYLIPFSFSLTS